MTEAQPPQYPLDPDMTQQLTPPGAGAQPEQSHRQPAPRQEAGVLYYAHTAGAAPAVPQPPSTSNDATRALKLPWAASIVERHAGQPPVIELWLGNKKKIVHEPGGREEMQVAPSAQVTRFAAWLLVNGKMITRPLKNGPVTRRIGPRVGVTDQGDWSRAPGLLGRYRIERDAARRGAPIIRAEVRREVPATGEPVSEELGGARTTRFDEIGPSPSANTDYDSTAADITQPLTPPTQTPPEWPLMPK